MAEQFCARHGVKFAYSDLIPLLEEQRPDVVHVTTPPKSHAPLALASIEAGSHVFVEKPLAESAEDAARIIHATERSRKKLTVGWTYYFDPAVRKMRTRVSQGLIGTPVHVEILQAYDLAGNFGKVVLAQPDHWLHDLRGKLLQNNLDHLLSLAVEFLPEAASLQDLCAWSSADSVCPDLFDELRLTLGDQRTSIRVTFSCRVRPIGYFLTIAGSKRTVRLNLTNQTLMVDSESALPGPLARLAGAFCEAQQSVMNLFQNGADLFRSDSFGLPGLRFLVAAFYQSIEQDDDVPIPYEHILSVSELMDDVIARSEMQPMTAR